VANRKIKVRESTLGKIKVRGNTLPKVDHTTVAEGLGAENYPPLPHLTKAESEKYAVLGIPVVIPVLNPAIPSPAAASTFLGSVKYQGSKMLQQNGKSLDEVVGYRILDLEEEPEFRKKCRNQYATVVRYYAKK